MYRSKFEARIAGELTKKKIKFDYEKYKLEYWTKVRSGKCGECESTDVYQQHWYVSDFYLPVQKIYLETKGKFTSQNRSKHIAIKEAHPEIDLRFIFMSNNKLNKNSSIRYTDWAERYGFLYAFNHIPNDWVNKT